MPSVDRPTDPGDRRPARTPRQRLDRPPGERYASRAGAQAALDRGSNGEAEAGSDRGKGGRAASSRRASAISLGVVISLAGALMLVVLGGLLALSAGLLVVAAVMGWAIGRVLATAPRSPGARRAIAGVLAADGVLLAQIGLWLVARGEGGVLGLVDYLVQTWGVLVPFQLLAAVVTAWWTAR